MMENGLAALGSVLIVMAALGIILYALRNKK